MPHALNSIQAIREQSRFLRLWKKEALNAAKARNKLAEKEEVAEDDGSDGEENGVEQADYDVEKILKKRVVGGRRELLIKWVGDPTPTWEPYENADGCPDRLDEFMRDDDDGFEEDEGEFDSD